MDSDSDRGAEHDESNGEPATLTRPQPDLVQPVKGQTVKDNAHVSDHPDQNGKQNIDPPQNSGGDRPKKTDLVIAAFTVVIALTGIVGALIFFYQLRAMSRQADTMQGQQTALQGQLDLMEISERPWLKIKSIQVEPGKGLIKTLAFHWPNSGKRIPPILQVKVIVENLGHSLAQEVDVHPELFFGKFDTNKWHDIVKQEEERSCTSVQSLRPEGGNGAIVFPSESWTYTAGVGGGVRNEDITRFPGSQQSYAASALIVCVNYRGRPGARYQTQAWSGLYENNAVFITLGLDADASSLRLIRDPSSDHAN